MPSCSRPKPCSRLSTRKDWVCHLPSHVKLVGWLCSHAADFWLLPSSRSAGSTSRLRACFTDTQRWSTPEQTYRAVTLAAAPSALGRTTPYTCAAPEGFEDVSPLAA